MRTVREHFSTAAIAICVVCSCISYSSIVSWEFQLNDCQMCRENHDKSSRVNLRAATTKGMLITMQDVYFLIRVDETSSLWIIIPMPLLCSTTLRLRWWCKKNGGYEISRTNKRKQISLVAFRQIGSLYLKSISLKATEVISHRFWFNDNKDFKAPVQLFSEASEPL